MISNNPEETIEYAKEYFNISKSKILGLVGNLGTGKTVFTQGIAQALGINEIVNSPTFVLMKIYKTKHQIFKQLVHVDAYRLTSAQELIDIGLEEYFNRPDTLIVIEWADKVKKNYHQKLS